MAPCLPWWTVLLQRAQAESTKLPLTRASLQLLARGRCTQQGGFSSFCAVEKEWKTVLQHSLYIQRWGHRAVLKSHTGQAPNTTLARSCSRHATHQACSLPPYTPHASCHFWQVHCFPFRTLFDGLHVPHLDNTQRKQAKSSDGSCMLLNMLFQVEKAQTSLSAQLGAAYRACVNLIANGSLMGTPIRRKKTLPWRDMEACQMSGQHYRHMLEKRKSHGWF